MSLFHRIKHWVIVLVAYSFLNDALASTEDKWTFQVAPYLWALNMNGDVQVGSHSTHISQNFSDILQELQGAGMLWLDLYKGRFGIYFNGLYAVLSQSEVIDGTNVDLKNDFGLFGVGLSYIVIQIPMLQEGRFEIEPYMGARYTLNDTELTLLGLSFSQNENWIDPLIGTRVRFIFTPRWMLTLYGDIGGTNFNTDKSYDLAGILGYTPQTHFKNTTVYLGYRYLYQLFATGNGRDFYEWNMKLFGPILGIGIRF